jgi:ATP synthase protein I
VAERGRNQDLAERIREKERRKSRARRQKERDVFFGLGMFGMIGWSVAIPLVLMTFLGLWLDRVWPQGFSWTLSLLLVGMIAGCLNAWYWVNRERGQIERDRDEQDRQGGGTRQ